MTTEIAASCSSTRRANEHANQGRLQLRMPSRARRAGAPGCHAVTPLLARFKARSAAWLGALSLPLLLSACGASAVNRGADLYARGHYVESAEVFEHTEPRLKAFEQDERARYGLYRGATLLGLGDLGGARRWLRYSSRLLEHDPRALPASERRFLQEALQVVERRTQPKLHTAMVEGRVAAHSSLLAR